MDKRDTLMRLARELLQAMKARDWTAMGNVDREVATLLSGAAAPWSEAEQAALRDLRAVHRLALECCELETAALDQRLAELRAHKEGWMAYALNDWQGNPTR
jgi:hypothetical protein